MPYITVFERVEVVKIQDPQPLIVDGVQRKLLAFRVINHIYNIGLFELTFETGYRELVVWIVNKQWNDTWEKQLERGTVSGDYYPCHKWPSAIRRFLTRK